MAIAVDASSPARWSGASSGAGVGQTSALFTPPNASLLVVTVELDVATTETGICTYSGGGWTWTERVARNGDETITGGSSRIATAPVTVGQSMAVTVTRTASSSASGRLSAVCRVLTVNSSAGLSVESVSAANEGSSATDDLTTTSVTPVATGLLIVADCDWNQAIVFDASADLTQDSVAYAGQMTSCSGYKACVAGIGVTANLNSGGPVPQHKWCQVIVTEPPPGPALTNLRRRGLAIQQRMS